MSFAMGDPTFLHEQLIPNAVLNTEQRWRKDGFSLVCARYLAVSRQNLACIATSMNKKLSKDQLQIIDRLVKDEKAAHATLEAKVGEAGRIGSSKFATSLHRGHHAWDNQTGRIFCKTSARY